MFVITQAHQATSYNIEKRRLYSCSGVDIAVFPDKKSARNAIKRTIRARKKYLNGRPDDTWSTPHCYSIHALEILGDNP